MLNFKILFDINIRPINRTIEYNSKLFLIFCRFDVSFDNFKKLACHTIN